ncbi:four and a half LIM domains protein 2-like [Symsagittifera roscoffensis]|uniref:four and a half LIM domains protein 2-like n=1 Tax=Symsagittifera roscoffensis TaxID=84072 RepID=UPI00307C1CB1
MSRDGAVFIAGCNKCSEKIFDISVNDGDEKFHDECFLCDFRDSSFECNKQLKNLEFHRKGGKRFCSQCYADFIAETCHKCTQKIIGTRMMRTQGDNKHFHFDCFTCVKCPPSQNQIGELPFTRVGGDFVCQKCYKIEHPDKECKICGDVITSSAVKDNLGSIYHRGCFTCAVCEHELAGKKYINRDSERYCKDCFDSHKAPLCCKCENRIKSDAQVLTYSQRSYCRDCFICHSCERSLANKSFYDLGDQVGFECTEKDERGNCK